MDDLLNRVQRPSQYLGNEINAITKDLSTVSCTVALCYPDLYEIGMSNTGLHIIYYMLNEDPEVAAERAYLPGQDLEALLKEDGRPLATLENRIPLNEVDILGIQLPHELAYTNIVKLIRMAKIPLWAKDRADEDPIVLGGGPGAFAPEPVAPFYDAILLGDAEDAFKEIVAVVRDARRAKTPRIELLRKLAALTGVYVPQFYAVDYHDDGTISEVRSTDEKAPAMVFKAVVDDLEAAYYPDKAIVPYAQTVHNRLGVEVMRGCTVGCRFCQAGIIYRPLRERSPKRIVDLAKCGLSATGYETVSLLSLDTGDYTLIEPLTKEILKVTEKKRVALSLPSLRAGSLTDDVIRDIRRVRRTSFTIAPEAGTQRLRDVINKNISDEEILETVDRISRNGWKAIKLYFMVGFPTETYEDLDGMIDLVLRCHAVGRKNMRGFGCTASIGTLVPKPQTPFQWEPQLSQEESFQRMTYVAFALRKRGVSCKYHDPKTSWLEGVLSRADRRLAPLIAEIEARGGGFESWKERLDLDLWKTVFAESDIDPETYLRQRPYEEILPWDHLSARVTRKYLLNDRKKIDRLESPTTFDCRDDLCAGCSVCFEGDTRNRLAKYHPDPMGTGKRLPMAFTSRVAVGHGVARQLEKSLGSKARDQAAKAGEDALAAKLRRRRPKKPGKRRWAVTPGAPGAEGPAEAFLPEGLIRDAAREAAELEQALQAPAPTSPEPIEDREPGKNPGKKIKTYHYRLIYERRGDLRWLAHREIMRTFYRLLLRCDLPLVYTQGFNPKPRIAFGPPLPVGAESRWEELDIHLIDERDPEAILAEFKRLLPGDNGLRALRVEHAFGASSAHSERRGARWTVDLSSLSVSSADAEVAVKSWAQRATCVLTVERPNKAPRQVDLKELLAEVSVADGQLCFDLRQHPSDGSAKPSEVVGVLLGMDPKQATTGRYLLVAPLRAERPLLLASTSPRRRELLAELNVAFEVIDGRLDDGAEQTLVRASEARGLDPAQIVQRIALAKLLATLPRLSPGQRALTADTTVASDGRPLGKASDRDHARAMLRSMAGREHHVHTGVATVDAAGRLRVDVATSSVTMKAFDDETLERYLDEDVWQGKAGAYGVQDSEAAVLVSEVVGSRSNVKGLPLELVGALLGANGQ